ncbi:hypothetical protein SISNIDRAFT_406593 [Sistotremastrum niveocremeum HHB9708]|uniref:Complex 1 LYR protein domain-containing protein n=2 Tax=Sistotremastraceae TaxID=3402574 RepID=A0A164YJ86_9AGAM|nr:hypothetical protein SISNIDRAFT_406593 [Sistotremastrum niveocremeum HHB9708]KZT43389.1 hypothetical protein SISSUDRAFT_978564 [Sistotremastrum suecicum HHB10207 ss-3]
MASVPSRAALLQLYSNTLRTSKSFSSYNFRNYFIRRTRDTFKSIQNEQDPDKLTRFYDEASKELEVLRRAALINGMYGGQKLVVEREGAVRLRGDT